MGNSLTAMFFTWNMTSWPSGWLWLQLVRTISKRDAWYAVKQKVIVWSVLCITYKVCSFAVVNLCGKVTRSVFATKVLTVTAAAFSYISVVLTIVWTHTVSNKSPFLRLYITFITTFHFDLFISETNFTGFQWFGPLKVQFILTSTGIRFAPIIITHLSDNVVTRKSVGGSFSAINESIKCFNKYKPFT